MTLNEFKAWFDGYTEDMDKPPTAKQWARIKKRVKEIDGQTITREVIYRNWPYYTTNYPFINSYCSSGVGGGVTLTSSTVPFSDRAHTTSLLFDAGRHDAAADV